MITLIHGDNLAESRKFLSEMREEFPGVSSFDGEEINLEILMQNTGRSGLFDEKNAIFIENFFSKRKQSNEKKSILEFLASKGDQTIVFWEGKQIQKKDLLKLPSIQIKNFDLPKILFKFIDSISPNNASISIKLFHETLQTESVELVFFMMVRKFRLLLSLADLGADYIDEVKSLQPWQRDKMQSQINLFGKNRLLKLFSELFEIESLAKVGSLPVSLICTIDFLLLTI